MFKMNHRGHKLTRACRPAHACSSRLEESLFLAAAPRWRRVLVSTPRHHRENEQVCRLKQCPLVFIEQTFELSQKHPSGAPPHHHPSPAALAWQQKGDFFILVSLLEVKVPLMWIQRCCHVSPSLRFRPSPGDSLGR